MAMTPRTGTAYPIRPRPVVAGAVRPVYEDFRPVTERKEDEESNNLLLIYLPGFQREHLKVSTEGRNILRVRGERLVAGNKWSRFQEDYPIPEDCNVRGIRARFEGGILTITIPRKREASKEAAAKDQSHQRSQENLQKAAVADDKTAAIMKSSVSAAPEKGRDREKTQETPTPDDQKKLSDKKQERISIPNEKSEKLSKEEIISFPNEQGKKSNQKREKISAPDLVPNNSTRKDTIENIIRNTTKSQRDEDGLEGGMINKTKQMPTPQEDEYVNTSLPFVTPHMVPERRNLKKPKLEKGEGKTTESGTSSSNAAKKFMDLREERQLLMNVGAAVLVIVAFGAYLSYTF